METQCAWCDSANVNNGVDTVYWELPDGTRAITITDVPTTCCRDCGMSYQAEKLIKDIENHLMIINTNLLGIETTYTNLMEQPKLLKRNYFDFTY